MRSGSEIFGDRVDSGRGRLSGRWVRPDGRNRWRKGPSSSWSKALERDGRLASYHYLPATKADLLRRLDRPAEARAAYAAARDLAGNEAERKFLANRADPI